MASRYFPTERPKVEPDGTNRAGASTEWNRAIA